MSDDAAVNSVTYSLLIDDLQITLTVRLDFPFFLIRRICGLRGRLRFADFRRFECVLIVRNVDSLTHPPLKTQPKFVVLYS